MRRPRYSRGRLHHDLASALRRLHPAPGAVLVLLDRRASLAEKPVRAALTKARLPAHWIHWPAAERRKTLGELERLARAAVRAGADRSAFVLAVGGGVTTDMGGFLAATLLRGLRWGAVPTTLLGLVDAAIGGKTAVDLPEGKNLVGAFHEPEFVLGDIALLRTLPAREWRCGLGEVLKTALLSGAPLLRRIERTPPAQLRRPSPAVLRLAQACADFKLSVVAADPRESGARAVLNLGHTFGHALEAAGGYRRLAHGEAVALGLLCALRFGAERGLTDPDLPARVLALVRRLGLPECFPGPLPAPTALQRLLRRDKKAARGALTLVLLESPGRCLLVHEMQASDVARTVREVVAGVRF